MGRHSKPSRIRLPHGATAAAGPTLAGVGAAALCLSPQAAPAAQAATTAAASATAPSHSAVLDADQQIVPTASASSGAAATASPQPAAPAAFRRTAPRKRHSAASALPPAYTVRPGDTLTSIAGHLYHDRAAWTVLYWRNHREIRWADDISTGQVLRVPAKPKRIPKAPAALEPAPAAAPAVSAAPAQSASAADTAYSGGVPGGAFGACVVAAESGGNAQVMNASGHYGLYQFSESTWVEYGGNPAEFGDATAAEQNQVFANALAAGGESNWAPYDGC